MTAAMPAPLIEASEIRRSFGATRAVDGVSLAVRPGEAYGLVGPIARASGVAYDVRRAFPYLKYDACDCSVPVLADGDVYARYLVRIAEMRESVKICKQVIDRITPSGPFAVDDPRITPPPKDRVYTEMEALIQHFLIYSQGFMQFKAGTAAAGAMIMFVLLLIVTTVQMRYVEKKVHY